MDDHFLIGKRIKGRRDALGLSGMQIQKATGISPGNLSSIEKGRSLPSAEAVIKLSKALSCSTDYILLGKEQAGSRKDADMLLSYRMLSLADRAEISDLIEFKLKYKHQKNE